VRITSCTMYLGDWQIRVDNQGSGGHPRLLLNLPKSELTLAQVLVL
jgi:hypothetical protein